MKKHKIKSFVLKSLNILPSSIGFYFYHLLQKATLKDISFYVSRNKQSLNSISSILEKNKIDINGKNILEIGSGWFPIMPILFKKEFNVQKIFTYDINKHYHIKRNKAAFNYLYGHPIKKENKYFLPNFIEYFPDTNLINTAINKEIEFVFSRFVLEHVFPEDILKIHTKLYKDLPKTAKVLHLISPSDHRAYSDNTLSYYDFLKYSDQEWNKIQTKFDYHNRLRLPEYLSIFEDSGFKIEFLKYDKVEKDSQKYVNFKKLTLNNRFTKFSEEEILAGSIIVLLSK